MKYSVYKLSSSDGQKDELSLVLTYTELEDKDTAVGKFVQLVNSVSAGEVTAHNDQIVKEFNEGLRGNTSGQRDPRFRTCVLEFISAPNSVVAGCGHFDADVKPIMLLCTALGSRYMLVQRLK